MERGWSAKELLKPLWREYEGGRDALALAVGSTGTVLSSINTGGRNLGQDLAGRLAGALEISVLELGAPSEAVDARGQSLHDRLEELAATVGDLLERQVKTEKEMARLRARVRKLEAQPATAGAAAKRLRKKAAQ